MDCHNKGCPHYTGWSENGCSKFIDVSKCKEVK